MHRQLGVVVPARDEAAGLASCLHALDRAAHIALVPLAIVVVLDSCHDASSAVVAATAPDLGSRLRVVEIDVGCVGTARRVGVETLLDTTSPGLEWIATTDADSTVPAQWFHRQLAHRAAGAALVAGRVRVTSWGARAELRSRWEHHYATSSRHVHGANLSFLPAAYQQCGGFPELAYDEDVALVAAFERADERVVWASDVTVTTSARAAGRAPHGFAAYLDALTHETPAVSSCVGLA